MKCNHKMQNPMRKNKRTYMPPRVLRLVPLATEG